MAIDLAAIGFAAIAGAWLTGNQDLAVAGVAASLLSAVAAVTREIGTGSGRGGHRHGRN